MRSLALVILITSLSAVASAQSSPWLADRGSGIPTSQFGTYVQPGELIVYPFFEYYKDKDFEYKPEELGFGVDEDFRGRYRASEAILFLGYGVSDRLAVEFEVAVLQATLEKSPDDPSAMPAKLDESGIGDIEGQVRWRWAHETASMPEIFSYYELVLPHHEDKPLIGTATAEHKLGTGLIKGFSFGTITVRGALESAGEGVEPGEFAIEYLKKISDRWQFYTGIEGVQDEIEWIVQVQRQIRPGIRLKLNNAFGVTSKATDWAPEIGVVFSFGGRR